MDRLRTLFTASHRFYAAVLMAAGVTAVGGGTYVEFGLGWALLTGGVLLIALSLLTGWE